MTGTLMPAAVTSASAQTTEADRHDDIVVRAERGEAETGYGVQAPSSATRDGKDLRAQPQSTTIITAKAIADQQIQTIAEALRNASGTTLSGGTTGTPDISVRGYTANATSNGLSTPLGTTMPIANVERIEVLKGPAAILAGADNLGGIVNIVAKRPVATPLLNASIDYASYDDRKITLDGSTPLDAARKFSTRLVLQADRAGDSPAGFDGRYEFLIAPSFRYKTATTDVVIGATASDRHDPAPRAGAFANPDGSPTDRPVLFPDRLGPAESGFRVAEQRAWYEATQRVTDWLTLASRGIVSNTQLELRIFGAVDYDPGAGFVLLQSDYDDLTRQVATDSYARIAVATGPLRHTLVAGYNRSRYRFVENYGDVPGIAFVSNLATDDLSLEPFKPATIFGADTQTNQDGVYLQDTIEVGPLHVVGGVRHSKYRALGFRADGASNGYDRRYAATTPNAGGVIDLSSSLSVYANYLRGFAPTFLLGEGRVPLPPTRTANIEGGVKYDLAGGRLAFVASYYRLRQQNLPRYEPALGYYTLIAGQESRGVEADLRGTIRPGWQVLGSLSHANYRYLQSVERVLAQPRTRYNLYTSYEAPSGVLKGSGVGLGVNGYSSSAVTATKRLGPQARFDANVYVTMRNLRLDLGVDNLLDRDIFSPSTNAYYLMAQPGRTVRATLTYAAF